MGREERVHYSYISEKQNKIFHERDKHEETLQVEKGYRTEHSVLGHLGNLASIESVFHIDIYDNSTISSILCGAIKSNR